MNEEISQVLVTAIGKFAELLEKSEERIDRINDMVLNLTKSAENQRQIVTMLTEKYTKHLDDLSKNRDEITRQNSELIKFIDRQQNQIEHNDKRIEILFEKMLDKYNAIHNVSESNINVKR